MLRVAALGMFLYGLHDVVVGAADLLGTGTLPWWANVWRMLAGAMLVLAAALVRVSMPGGLALAVAALLGLQSISLHNDAHFYGRLDLMVLPQSLRAVFAATLVALAHFGWGMVGGGESPPTAQGQAETGSHPDPDAP
ncbi:MAG: hypothetical protein OXQ28_01670 [Acidobacteriota bacterium]|nr:hypothetical protein [Acidobacteriota bacterium]